MVVLEFSKIVPWMMIVLLITGIAVREELQTRCPLYRNHFCACSVDEPAKVTPLKMCSNKVSGGGNCEPCTRHVQTYLNCSKCPENKCPICSVDEFGPQHSHNKSNDFKFRSHPAQVFFSFSTGQGNIINVTPNSTHIMLPNVSHTSSYIPKYVEKLSKFSGNHESNFMTIQNVVYDTLIKYFKYRPLKKQEHVSVNSILLANYNVPDSESNILIRSTVDSEGRFKRDEAEAEPIGIKNSAEIPDEGVSIRPQLHQPTSMNMYPFLSKKETVLYYRKIKVSNGKRQPIRNKEMGDKGKKHNNVTENMDMVPIAYRLNNKPDEKLVMNSPDKIKNTDLSNASLLKYKGNPSLVSQITEADGTFDTLSGDSSYIKFDNGNATYSPINNGYSLSSGVLSMTSTSPRDTAYVKTSEVLNITDNLEGDELSRHDFSDKIPVPLTVVNETTSLLVTTENETVEESIFNYQGKFKSADLSNASLFKYRKNPFFDSHIRHGDVFHTVRGDSSYTEFDNVNKRYSPINNGYSLSMPFEKLSTVSTPPHDMAHVKNSEVLNNPDNHEVGEFSRQDFSGNSPVPFDVISEATFQLVTAENETDKGNGTGIMSSDIHEGQLSESSLKPFSTDENPENVSLNLQKLYDFRSHVQEIRGTRSSSDYTTDQNLSSKQTPEYSVGENQTADLFDQRVTGSHRIVSSDTADQRGMSNLPTTTERINNDNESLNFGLSKESEISLSSFFTVQDFSEYAADQKTFGNVRSENTEIQTNETKSVDKHIIMSSNLSDGQLGKTNLPIYSQGENHNGDGDFRETNDTSSHLRSTLFVQGSSGYATPQHFLTDVTSEKAETDEGSGTYTTENLKVMSPYPKEQQLEQSKLPTTLQTGDNGNEDVNFSTTVHTESHSSHTLVGQDTSDYRSDEHFFGSETSKYIVDDRGTIGTNDMQGIDKLTIMSSDKRDQQLGGSNLPTIPNDENFDNKGIHFRMMSNSTREYQKSLDENGNNRHFLGDVSSRYKGEEKETTGTESHSSRTLAGQDTSDYRSDEHFFGSETSKYVEDDKGTIVTNDMNGIDNLTIMSSDKPDQQLGGLNFPTIPHDENAGKENVNFSTTDDTKSHSSRTLAGQDTSDYRSDEHFFGSETTKYIEDYKGTIVTNDMNYIDNLTIMSSDKPDQQLGGFTVQDSSEYATDQHLFRDKSSELPENQTTERKSVDMSSHLSDEPLGKTNLPIFSHGENYSENGDLRQINDSSSHLRITLFVQGASGYVIPQHFLNDFTSKKPETAEGTGTDTTKISKIMSPYLQEQQYEQSKLPTTLQEGTNDNDDVNFSTTVDTESHSSHTLAGQDTSYYRSDEHFFGSETSKYIVDDRGTIGTNDMQGIDKLTIMSSDKRDQQLGGSNLPKIPNDENFDNKGIHFRMLSNSTREFQKSLDENGNNKHFLGDVSPEYKGEGKETTGTNVDKIDNLTVGSMPYSEKYPGQSNWTIAGASQQMVTNDEEHINKFVGLSSNPSNVLPDSTASSPLFENSEKFDTKRGNVYSTTPHISTENRHEISAIESRTSTEEQSNYSSGHSRHADENYTGNGFSTQKYRIGRKLPRFAEIDHNKPKASHFRISDFVRKRRLTKDSSENTWCPISGNALHGSLKCSIWSHKKICVIKCLGNRYIGGEREVTFTCNRRNNVWEPKLQSCLGDGQGNHGEEYPDIEKIKVQDSKMKNKEADGSEEVAHIYENGNDNDSQSASDDYGEYESD